MFNGAPKFKYNADTNTYIGITDFLKDHDKNGKYLVHGMFVTKTGKYGPRGIVVLDGFNLYVPKHINEKIVKIRENSEAVEAINAGRCVLTFYDYEKDGAVHTSVRFEDAT